MIFKPIAKKIRLAITTIKKLKRSMDADKMLIDIDIAANIGILSRIEYLMP
jgi:hypothetical protein